MTLAPATAGQRVRALAHAFVDDLLADEQRCLASITVLFRQGLASREREVRSAVGKDKPSLTALQGPFDEVETAWERAAARASVEVQALAEIAVEKGLTSMRAELTEVEATLPVKYRGMAADAVAIARGDMDVLIDAEMLGWAKAAAEAELWMLPAMRLQVAPSPDADTLVLRWFSESPAGLRGFGGRGIWWQSLTGLNGAARGVSIHGANRARSTAMQMMNMLYREARDG